ncbi:sigma-54 dependent transcriptional regulator [Lutimaribacter sp. EGI FJ00015]|uniref:Sigma-54 dependent transcriptional regulator n=1 Tax=Lutimaribacter degradans TaxID=2945989 RepID=A0ACC5ZS27_9RHOB|nr:sigma-54 dependent transcriptional regulator [Lutimaribacter sp. EGI FJ00013]MCM2560980.1 sigma-54 dependent transcriptional regulator [Lutimaribacter sp. EGI FJ00013]MCO0612073.1 sigma-54 dependent transcriptional regulator [Lutimaribacter sp. EGI FJ00015]MCO0634807.1 sigma-54 dependent transcriptional regulator [Lutimaribacter sp. EGI FJ00014]
MTRSVLVVDDDASVRAALAQTLELADLAPITAGSFIEAKDAITREFDGIVLSDIRMPGRDGFHLLDHAHKVDADLPVILLTGEGDIPMAVRAMGQGAFGFLEKPCPPADLLATIERALQTRALILENRRLKAQLDSGDAAARMLFGHSALAEDLRARVRLVAQSEAEVLVSGPPGSGISKVAEVVHLCSSRAKGAFVKRAAAGLDARGFDAACAEAVGGALFLDEVGNLPRATQFAAYQRIEAGLEARLVAGSTANLQALSDEGKFLPDLFYRLDVMRVRIPSLAERPDDIPVLFRHYVAQACEQAGLRPPEIGQEVIARLMARDWPGNARALMNAAMRFALGLEGDDDGAQADTGLGLAEQMAQVERSLLIEALRRAEGRAAEAAKRLKLPRKTFYDKLARHGLKPGNFR